MQPQQSRDTSASNRSQFRHPDDQKNTKHQGYDLKKYKWWAIIALVIIVLTVGFWLYKSIVSNSRVDGSKYQAVFLSNGQAYFGKLHDYGTNQPYLTNVYYIQTPSGSKATDTATMSDQQMQLIKLGGEVHGPEDEMILNKDAILFVENLTDKSKVVDVINSKE